MTPFWWALIFGGLPILAAVVISVVCVRARLREIAEEDASYPRPEPVDRELWAPDAPLWNSDLYAALGEFKPAEGRPHIAAMQARDFAEEDEWLDRMEQWANRGDAS